MAHKDKHTISKARSNVSKGVENSSGNVRGRGPPEIRNKTLVPDHMIQTEIDRSRRSIRDEFPDRTIDFDQNENADRALKYFTFIRSYYLVRDEKGPKSVSHARRYDYDDEQLRYWRDQMINALQDI